MKCGLKINMHFNYCNIVNDNAWTNFRSQTSVKNRLFIALKLAAWQLNA